MPVDDGMCSDSFDAGQGLRQGAILPPPPHLSFAVVIMTSVNEIGDGHEVTTDMVKIK